MNRIRIGAPLTLLVVAGCVAGTYLPGARHFGISGGFGALLAPWTWLQLVTWPFVHAGTSHLVSNMMLFLLLSPNLEKQQGWAEYAFCLVVSSVVIGVAHLAFGASGTALIGSSGWVFMMILLTTFLGGESGTISVPTLIVAGLYAFQEVRAALGADQVSHFAHLLGGACGVVFGLLGSGEKAGKTASAPAIPGTGS